MLGRAQMINGFFGIRRSIHTSGPIRPEILICNNHTGLYFADKALDMPNGRIQHPNLKILIPESWLDRIHEDYFSLPWGQTIHGLPWFAQKIFLEANKNYSGGTITWEEIIRSRDYLVETLPNKGIEVLRGTPDVLQKEGGDFDIAVNNQNFIMPQDTLFYNLHKTAFLPDITGLSGVIDKKSCTDFYRNPRSEVPDSVVLIGGARTAIWFAQHFPDVKVQCYMRDADKVPLFIDEQMPENMKIYRASDYRLDPAQTVDGAVLITHAKGGDAVAMGELAYATGFKLDKTVLAGVPKENIKDYPMDPSPYSQASWIGPEKIPVGSLLEATARWAIETNNEDWCFEPSAFHSSAQVVEKLALALKSENIELSNSFSEKLYTTLKSENHNGLSDENVGKLYVEAYKQSEDNVSPDKITAFKKSFDRLLNDRNILTVNHASQAENDTADETIDKTNESGNNRPGM